MERIAEEGRSYRDYEIKAKTTWAIEARNRHIEPIFKFFTQMILIQHVSNLGAFYKIAGAMINKHHSLLML